MAIALTSCALSMGFEVSTFPKFTDEGFFKEDTIYTLMDETFTFYADGTYLHEDMTYEESNDDDNNNGITNEGCVLRDGKKGTYVYDVDNIFLTLNYTEDFGYVGASDPYAWHAQTNDYDDIKKESTTILYEDMMIDYEYCFNQDASDTTKWVTSEFYYELDGSRNTETETYQINADGNSIIYTSSEIDYDETNTITYGYERIKTYTITRLLPEDIKWKKGNTVTFQVIRTEYKYRSYNTIEDTWGDWTVSTDQRTETLCFTHMDTYLIKDLSPVNMDMMK